MLDKTGRTLRRLLGPSPQPKKKEAAASRAARRADAVASGRRHQRATPPNVVGAGPLIAAPGLRLGVVVIIRDEASYLEEWLAYHHALGVDHVFLYDNGSTDGLAELIEPWINHGLLTRIEWPLPGSQIDAYNHALRFFGPSVEWLAFFDVDEFVVPLVDDSIPDLLARFPDAADVRVPRKEFGFSGHRTRPEGLVVEAYTGVADVFGRDPEKGARVKTIVQPRGVSAVGVHTATVADVAGPVAGDEAGRPFPTRTVRAEVSGLAQLNHYYTRSFEEFEAKRFRGSATGRIARPPVPFDQPILETDTSAHRFIPRTLATIERMRSLERQPYRYGSQLRLAQFPRSNDLGLFGEFACANVVAGLTEPTREPAMRLPNQFLGMGFLGDVGAADHAPVTGDISGSIHLPQLVDHVRGRLDAVLGDLRGALADEGTAIRLADGRVDLVLPVEHGGRRRCYALGFEVTVSAPAEMELSLVHDDGPPSPAVVVRIERASTWVGIVEVDDAPRLASAIAVTVRGEEPRITVHDLFIISYG